MNKNWDSRFFSPEVAKMLGDSRFDYVPFHQLSADGQYSVLHQRYFNVGGGMYPFVDEYYLYPVTKQGKLAKARRILSIPLTAILDAEFMASLGYELSSGWSLDGRKTKDA